jgi:hypothetical protein
VKNVAVFLPDYAETANVTICSGTPRAHGQRFLVTDRRVFAPIADNILLGALVQGVISRRPFERGSSSGPNARQSLPFLEGKTSHEPHDPYCYARQQW